MSASTMSVVFEPRNFAMHDGSYPPLGAEPDDRDNVDHDAAVKALADDVDRFHDAAEVAALASNYPTQSLLGDDRSLMGDERSLMAEVDESTHSGATSTAAAAVALRLPSPRVLVVPLTEPSGLPLPPIKSSPEASTPSRVKAIPKPDREVTKQADGKFYCEFPGCTEDSRVFSRKCEWSKHMDKHERPYRCNVDGCEKLPGFTYSGGLLRHEREVHGKHGGPKNTVNCPYANCKRHTGKGFSRQENLNEHLRRVHTNDITAATTKNGEAPPPVGDGLTAMNAASTTDADAGSSDDGASEQAGQKRKRSRRDDAEGLSELQEEIKRMRKENLDLREQVEQQSRSTLEMVAQIAELQEALRMNTLATATAAAAAAPTAPMI